MKGRSGDREPLRIRTPDHTPARQCLSATAATGSPQRPPVLEGSLPNPLRPSSARAGGVVEDVGGAVRTWSPRHVIGALSLCARRVLRRRAPEPLRGPGDHAGPDEPPRSRDGERSRIRASQRLATHAGDENALVHPPGPLDRVALIGLRRYPTGSAAVFTHGAGARGREVAYRLGGIGSRRPGSPSRARNRRRRHPAWKLASRAAWADRRGERRGGEPVPPVVETNSAGGSTTPSSARTPATSPAVRMTRKAARSS